MNIYNRYTLMHLLRKIPILHRALCVHLSLSDLGCPVTKTAFQISLYAILSSIKGLLLFVFFHNKTFCILITGPGVSGAFGHPYME